MRLSWRAGRQPARVPARAFAHVLRRTPGREAGAYHLSIATRDWESPMTQVSATAPAAPSFTRAFVGFLSSITLMTTAMVVLGSLSA
jgi:hypothetical protein